MKLSLGTAQFGMDYGLANQTGKVDLEKIKKILEFSKANGINFIDTAVAYGDSEKQLGQCNIESFNIVTKIPAILRDQCAKEVVFNYVEESLSRLNIEKIYGVLIHDSSFSRNANAGEIWGALQEAKQQGLIGKIGVSLYEPSEYLDLSPLVEIDLVQIPYNLIDRRFVESGVARMMKSKSIEIHTRSVFLQGLLLMPFEKQVEYFPAHIDLWKRFSEVTSGDLYSKIDMALSFVSSCEYVDRMVVGVDSLGQLSTLISVYQKNKIDNWPDIGTLDRRLINPSNWDKK